MRGTTKRVLILFIWAWFFAGGLPGPVALAQTPRLRRDTWVTDGIVRAVATAPGRVYLGGDFLDADDHVLSMASAGSNLFVGGRFTTLSMVPRNRLAALDAYTGAATNWNPGANDTVDRLPVSENGDTVYAAGDFSRIGGVSRRYLVALSATTGAATNWNPVPGGGATHLTAYDTETGSIIPFAAPHPFDSFMLPLGDHPYVCDLALNDMGIYAGGYLMTRIEPRHHFYQFAYPVPVGTSGVQSATWRSFR